MPPLHIFLATPSFFSFSSEPFSSHPVFDPVRALQYIIQVDKRLTAAEPAVLELCHRSWQRRKNRDIGAIKGRFESPSSSIDEFGGWDKIEGTGYCLGLEDRKWNYDGPILSTEVGETGEENKKRERQFKSFSFKSPPPPRDCRWPPLTSVGILTPSSVMAPRDGRGFADLPEKLKAPRIFS